MDGQWSPPVYYILSTEYIKDMTRMSFSYNSSIGTTYVVVAFLEARVCQIQVQDFED